MNNRVNARAVFGLWIALCGGMAIMVPQVAFGQQTCPADGPTVTIDLGSGQTGTICGAQDRKSDLYTFKGIPFAINAKQKLGGTDRFQSPSPIRSSYTVQATEFGTGCIPVGAIAPQIPGDLGSVEIGEDCLFLNVWTPQLPDASDGNPNLPVMVFIYGGAFVFGNSASLVRIGPQDYIPLYDGTSLASKGVVVVTLNYRLGALGFLYQEADPSSQNSLQIGGNFGILDQQLALQWVYDNIGQFGGAVDSDGKASEVTLFGESAGAMSTGLHLFSIPSSAQYFKRAIMESNPLGSIYKSAAAAHQDGLDFLKIVCDAAGQGACSRSSNPVPSMELLQAIDPFVLAQLEKQYLTSLSGEYTRISRNGIFREALSFSPTIDGRLIVSQPVEGYADDMPTKPFMMGVNADEGAYFASEFESLYQSRLGNLLEQIPLIGRLLTFGNVYDALVIMSFPNAYNSIQAVDAYKSQKQSKGPFETNGGPALSHLLNDFAFRCGSYLAASNAIRQRKSDQVIYTYVFAQDPYFNVPGSRVCTAANDLVCHGEELPYVFGVVERNPGTDPAPTATDIRISKDMLTYWTEFAKGGDPSPQSADVADWPLWHEGATGAIQLIGNSHDRFPEPLTNADMNSRSHCSDLWNEIYPTIIAAQ